MCNTHRMPTSKPDLIGSREACVMLDVATSSLVRWVADGRLCAAHKMPGRNGAFLFHRTDVEALVRERADIDAVPAS